MSETLIFSEAPLVSLWYCLVQLAYTVYVNLLAYAIHSLKTHTYDVVSVFFKKINGTKQRSSASVKIGRIIRHFWEWKETIKANNTISSQHNDRQNLSHFKSKLCHRALKTKRLDACLCLFVETSRH
jgi:hypothetical protein